MVRSGVTFGAPGTGSSAVVGEGTRTVTGSDRSLQKRRGSPQKMPHRGNANDGEKILEAGERHKRGGCGRGSTRAPCSGVTATRSMIAESLAGENVGCVLAGLQREVTMQCEGSRELCPAEKLQGQCSRALRKVIQRQLMQLEPTCEAISSYWRGECWSNRSLWMQPATVSTLCVWDVQKRWECCVTPSTSTESDGTRGTVTGAAPTD